MIGGQPADVLGEPREPTLELARYIHAHKTASLFETACRLGALAARGNRDQGAVLGRYGQRLGRAFQIADDLLDETSTTRALGKDVAKDARAGKQTCPGCVGMKESMRAVEEAGRWLNWTRMARPLPTFASLPSMLFIAIIESSEGRGARRWCTLSAA